MSPTTSDAPAGSRASCQCPALDPVTCKSLRYGHGESPDYVEVPPCGCRCHRGYDASTDKVC